MSKPAQTILSLIVAPILLPVDLALAVVDTLVFRDKTTLGEDFHAATCNAISDIAGEPRPFDE